MKAIHSDRLVAIVYGAIGIGSLIFDASHHWFWQRQHETAPVAGLVLLVLLSALLLRQRWAWWILLFVDATAQLTFFVDLSRHPFSWLRLGELMLGFAQLALLLSNPMRRYVGIRGRLGARDVPSAGSPA